MKKQFILFFLCIVSVSSAWAGIALVYKTEADVSSNKPMIGFSTEDGIVVSAQDVLGAQFHFYVGLPGQKLCEVTLVRLDNDANLALFRLGAAATSDALQAAHQKNSAAVLNFFPSTVAAEKITGSMDTVVAGSTEPFVVKIDGQEVGDTPILLKKKRKQAEFILEAQSMSAAGLWRVTLNLQTDPSLSFWKKGDQHRGLNDIPQRKYQYTHQLMFSPLAKGQSIKVRLEAFGIKEENYEFTVKVESKAGDYEKKIAVKFEEKK